MQNKEFLQKQNGFQSSHFTKRVVFLFGFILRLIGKLPTWIKIALILSPLFFIEDKYGREWTPTSIFVFSLNLFAALVYTRAKNNTHYEYKDKDEG